MLEHGLSAVYGLPGPGAGECCDAWACRHPRSSGSDHARRALGQGMGSGPGCSAVVLLAVVAGVWRKSRGVPRRSSWIVKHARNSNRGGLRRFGIGPFPITGTHG